MASTIKRYLWIRNDTAISASFQVAVEHFQASSTLTLDEVTPPPPTPVRSAITTVPKSSRPVLERTANLGDPHR
jgi:hypothetical protein